MAEDDADRANEVEAERAVEIDEELERIGRDGEEVTAGDGALGTQNAPREDAEALEELEDADAEDEPLEDVPEDDDDG